MNRVKKEQKQRCNNKILLFKKYVEKICRILDRHTHAHP